MKKVIIGLSAVPGILLAAENKQSPTDFENYVVKSGDTLFKIAQREIGRRIDDSKGLESLKLLISANPQLKNPNQIRVGERINIPGIQALRSFHLKEGDSRKFHIVQKGENLSLLAKDWMGLPFFKKNYQGSLQLVVAANPHIKNPNKIEVGDFIYIPRQVDRFISSEKQALRFHFPSEFIVNRNKIISTESRKLSVTVEKSRDEGHLVIHR